MTDTLNKLLIANIGKNIAKERKRLRLTQSDVAERLGLGLEAISRIERGVKAPSLDQLVQLADIFACRIDEFILKSSDRSIDRLAYINEVFDEISDEDQIVLISIIEQFLDSRSVKIKKLQS